MSDKREPKGVAGATAQQEHYAEAETAVREVLASSASDQRQESREGLASDVVEVEAQTRRAEVAAGAAALPQLKLEEPADWLRAYVERGVWPTGKAFDEVARYVWKLYQAALVGERPQLQALIQTWRERADEPIPTDRSIGIEECANELEAALRGEGHP